MKCIDRKGLLGKEDSLENEIRVLQRYLQKLILLSYLTNRLSTGIYMFDINVSKFSTRFNC